MSKKRKSNGKHTAKKAVSTPIRAKNGHARPAAAEIRVGTATAGPAEPPFWARMPFAIMDFWFGRPERGHAKS